MNIHSDENTENLHDTLEDDIRIIEAKHRTTSQHRRMNQKGRKPKKDIYDVIDICKEIYEKNNKQILITLFGIVLVVVLIVSVAAGKEESGQKSEQPDKGKAIVETAAAEGESAEETTAGPVLTIEPESQESEITQLIFGFYNAYVISGDINEVGKYIDSTNAIDPNRLSINKKYIESVSDFVCYKSGIDNIDEDYTALIVTYKVKLYNYAELLPSVDILFLVNGDAGYKVHNLTVDDEFDKQKVENDEDFQILKTRAAEELNELLAANAELNEVYNLYLNPESANQNQ